jgi:hypothetical protein
MTGVSETTAAELLDLPDPSEAPEREEAEAFLMAELADGPRPARPMQQARLDAGISDRQLKRAKKALGVISEKLPDGTWQWRLNQEGHPGPEGQGGRPEQEGRSYISNPAPFTPQAKYTHIISNEEGQGGRPKEIAVALLKSEFQAEDITGPPAISGTGGEIQ